MKGENSHRGDVAESPAVDADPGLSNCTTHIVTGTVSGDETEHSRPRPKPGAGELGKVVSLPENRLLQRLVLRGLKTI